MNKRPPFMEITWHDYASDAVGYVVIDRLLRGVSSGGLRMRAGCTIDEVRGLAAAMTRKEAIHFEQGMHYVPVGGAKGGINFDPADPEAPKVIERFLDSLSPILRSYWAVGEDFGVQQDVIDEIYARRGWGSPVAPVRELLGDAATIEASDQRCEFAFAQKDGGITQDELVGGYGVAVSAVTALKYRNYSLEETRAVVQGFGSMGGATARYLVQMGVQVVGVADARGTLYDPAGLDVEDLLQRRDRLGAINRDGLPDSVQQIERDQWLELPCELLVPAAISGCITTDNCDGIQAKLIVEAANLPVTPDAEALLTERGVEVIPDFIANSGTNAWWWWVLFGDVDGTWESSRLMLEKRLGALTSEAMKQADASDCTVRQSGEALSKSKLHEVETLEGTE